MEFYQTIACVSVLRDYLASLKSTEKERKSHEKKQRQ